MPTAYWVRLRLPRLRPVIEFITLLPLVIPAIVVVFGYIRLYNTSSVLPLTGSASGTNLLLLCGYATALPYMYRAVDTGLSTPDVRSLTEAAQSLGVGWVRIIGRLILPNVLGRGDVGASQLCHRHWRSPWPRALLNRPLWPLYAAGAQTAPMNPPRWPSSPLPPPGAAWA